MLMSVGEFPPLGLFPQLLVVGEGGGGELPDREGVQEVPVQSQHSQGLQTGECLLGNGWK